MASKAQTEHIKKLVQTIAVGTGRPVSWYKDLPTGGTNVGALSADYSSIYGGWQLVECVSEGGAESLGPCGMPRPRYPTAEFIRMLEIAAWWANGGEGN